MREAPLYAQSAALARWLMENLGGDPAELVATIHRDAIRLFDAIVLALKGFERDEQILRADEAATLLRAHLRLVHDCGGLPERQLVHVLGQLDEIGRQIGGWQRRLQSDRVTPRHR